MIERKKSNAVPAILVMSIAALVIGTGCSDEPRVVRRCFDGNGQMLPEYICNGGYAGSSYYYGGRSYIFYGSPHWGYGGSGSYVVGGYASGYNRTMPSGSHIVSPSGSTISRGGFGGSASSGFGGLG